MIQWILCYFEHSSVPMMCYTQTIDWNNELCFVDIEYLLNTIEICREIRIEFWVRHVRNWNSLKFRSERRETKIKKKQVKLNLHRKTDELALKMDLNRRNTQCDCRAAGTVLGLIGILMSIGCGLLFTYVFLSMGATDFGLAVGAIAGERVRMKLNAADVYSELLTQWFDTYNGW